MVGFTVHGTTGIDLRGTPIADRMLAAPLVGTRLRVCGGRVEMRTDVFRIIESFSQLRLLVIGDAILDRYLTGSSLRFCREAPVPNVTISGRTDSAGGAANAAVNARALGARVEFLGVLGDDAEARSLVGILEAADIGIGQTVRDPQRQTRTKHRVIAEQQLLLSYDIGDATAIAAHAEQQLLARLAALHGEVDAVLVSDYGYGTLTAAVLARLADLRRAAARVLVVDSRHRLPLFRDLRPTAVKPNFEEATELLGERALCACGSRAEAIVRNADLLLERTGANLVAATLDRDGAVLIEPHAPAHRIHGRRVEVRNAAGAGDTFIAALTLALAAGATSETAGELAAAAAAVAIGRDGTVACSREELRGSFAPTGKLARDINELAARVDAYREQGRRVVFTNGCFDILHRGHVTLLNQAKALGDVLVVAVNSDDGIRRLKGPERPINSFENRVQVLGALGCVDHVIGFETDTCSHLVERLRPHIFVKGGDYTPDTLPEATAVARVGGVVHLLPYLSDRSTTGLIERIQRPSAHALA